MLSSNGHYELAPEVEAIAKPLIDLSHGHLKKAKISYVFRDKAWRRGAGMVVLGKANKRNELDQLLSPKREDFVVIISKDKWIVMAEVEREQLVDHELCHCGIALKKDGTTKFVLMPHTIEEFPENLFRFEHRQKYLSKLIEECSTRRIRGNW
jgi:hypothetical protein